MAPKPRECGVIEVEPAGGAKCRMAGEFELLAHGEDAYVDAAFALDLGRAREDEGGLAEVGLAGDGLHLGGGEAASIGEDGEGVAFEGLLGEDVDDGHSHRVGWRRWGGSCRCGI